MYSYHGLSVRVKKKNSLLLAEMTRDTPACHNQLSVNDILKTLDVCKAHFCKLGYAFGNILWRVVSFDKRNPYTYLLCGNKP